LDRLTFGDYTLSVRHEAYCTASDLRSRVEAGKTIEPLTVALRDGAIVRGVVTDGGEPQAGVTVELSTTAAGKDSPRAFTAVTREDGSYHFAERLPAGDYRITAFRQAGPGANPFEQLNQRQRNSRELEIAPGQREVTQMVDLR
ncbi:MAG: carboxypeptidase regulatory-like domain-containing protein, partial [Planctomycetes bacterium]|nr:carboxypeptidase regulatory-like domain-containing protein [Planctomycetota bacterium]